MQLWHIDKFFLSWNACKLFETVIKKKIQKCKLKDSEKNGGFLEIHGPVAYKMKLSLNLWYICNLPKTENSLFLVEAQQLRLCLGIACFLQWNQL